MKVAVFGGLGFLGQYLVAALRERGHQVTIIDLPGRSQVPYVTCDIRDREAVLAAIPVGTEVVYNLAGFANLDRAVNQPYATMELNVMGNLNILEACVAKTVGLFVYASSAYATSNKGSFYGISKLASEKLTEEYQRKYQLPFVILRYGSVYAELDFENNYIFQLIKDAVQTGKIVHQGDGQEIREYIHAADAARLSVEVIEDDQFRGQHVVLTGVERMKRIELFEMIREMLDGKVDIELTRDGYQHHYKYTPYSFEAARSRKLVANPFIDMGQGLLECIRAVHQE